MKIELESNDISTIRLALQAWAIRCDREAKSMMESAKDHWANSEINKKCIANADASGNFAKEAREVLAKLP